MAWNNTAVTTAGNALLQRVLAGEKLHLDYAAGGSGTVDTASLMAQTTLINQQQMFNIVGLSKVANGQKVNIQILNAELKTGYIMQQIGIWAHIGTEEPLLFAVLQDEKGIDIPSEYEVGDFALNFYAVIDFSNQSEFQITVDPSALVTHATLLDEMSKKANLQHEHISSEITGLSKVATSGKYTDLSEIPTVINTPEEGSLALITSGGVYEAVKAVTPIVYNLTLGENVTDLVFSYPQTLQGLIEDLEAHRDVNVIISTGGERHAVNILRTSSGTYYFQTFSFHLIPLVLSVRYWKITKSGDVSYNIMGIRDFVIEEDTSGIWTYRKWASGIAECWCKLVVNTTIESPWKDSVFYVSGKFPESTINFPFEFTESPLVSTSVDGTYSAIFLNGGSPPTKKTLGNFHLARPVAMSDPVDFIVSISVKGNWK